MTKRRLTRQQAWRIEKIQAERARRARRREETAGEDGGLGPETEGVVIAHYGSQLDVEAAANPGSSLLQLRLSPACPTPCFGLGLQRRTCAMSRAT